MVKDLKVYDLLDKLIDFKNHLFVDGGNLTTRAANTDYYPYDEDKNISK